MQVDPIEHVLDQLLEEDARRDADPAPQAAGNGPGQTVQVCIVRTLQNALRNGGAVGVEITNPPTDALQAGEVEVLQSHLRRPWIVEPVRTGEVHREALGEWGQALHPLRPLEERRRPRDHQIQARETAGIDLVEHLSEGVQALLPHVATHPLERFHLIEHYHQPREARVAEDDEQALEEAEGAEVIEISLDAGVPLGRGANVRLPADPGQERFGGGALVPGHRPSPGAERRGERRRVARDRCEAPFHEIRRPAQECFGIALRNAPLGQDVFLQCIEPVVEDGPEGTLPGVSGRKAFGQPAVYRFEAVQRRLRFRDLHLGRGESVALRPLLQPPHEEGLPAAVLAANRLELRATGGYGCQFFRDHGLERIQTDRERIQTAPGNGAAP